MRQDTVDLEGRACRVHSFIGERRELLAAFATSGDGAFPALAARLEAGAIPIVVKKQTRNVDARVGRRFFAAAARRSA